MNNFTSPLTTPISAIIFDCDGTLSTLEGIDELANQNEVGAEVEALTTEAMGKTGINPLLYEKRLRLTNPHQEQVTLLGQDYFTLRVPYAQEVISILQRLNKTVYIISAGLYPAVAIFGELLGVPRQNIFAVKVSFDRDGHYDDYDHHSPLVNNDGKRAIVSQIKMIHKEIAYVGDGLNDLAAYDLATRFIGFGGAYYRENVKEKCEVYLEELSMAPILSLVLTEGEKEKLSQEERRILHSVSGCK
jgi:phosphoserine phosphatase